MMNICSLIVFPDTSSVTKPMKKPICAMRPFTFSAYGVNPCGPRYSLSSRMRRFSSRDEKVDLEVRESFLSFTSTAMRAARRERWGAGDVLSECDGETRAVRDRVAAEREGVNEETKAMVELTSDFRRGMWNEDGCSQTKGGGGGVAKLNTDAKALCFCYIQLMWVSGCVRVLLSNFHRKPYISERETVRMHIGLRKGAPAVGGKMDG